MVRTAFTDTQATPWFAVAGFGAYFAFMLWYKGNAMCGTALGMSCNGAFSFWGPFSAGWCWALVRHRRLRPGPHRLAGGGGHVRWASTIAVNPVDFFKRKG